MSAKNSIEWTDVSWNPVRGCSLVSEGCRNCYAMKQAHRFNGPGHPYEGLTEMGPNGPRWNGKITLIHDALEQPLHWKKPRRIFVNSMSDLFHEDVPDEFIDKVFAVMALCRQHTFQILTKRPVRMRSYLHDSGYRAEMVGIDAEHRSGLDRFEGPERQRWPFPLPNVWLGVSVENQATADERIPLLLQAPAAVRFVSAEPLLGPVDFDVPWPPDFPLGTDPNGDTFDALRFDDCNSLARLGHLDWVIVGGESGPGARACDVAWVRSIKGQCLAADVPVFIKQLGSRPFVVEGSRDAQEWSASGASAVMDDCGGIHAKDKKGGDMAEWPEDLRVREWPR